MARYLNSDKLISCLCALYGAGKEFRTSVYQKYFGQKLVKHDRATPDKIIFYKINLNSQTNMKSQNDELQILRKFASCLISQI